MIPPLLGLLPALLLIPFAAQGTIVTTTADEDDGDASPYGTEQALGTDPLISDPSSFRNITAPALNASGHAVLSFGIGSAAPGTRWILSRSTDLLGFAEIYRFDGSADTAVPGVTFLRTATGVTVTDTNPPPGATFYRFEALLEP
jgi:hypothetical protein